MGRSATFRKILGLVMALAASSASSASSASDEVSFFEEFTSVSPKNWQVANYKFSHPHFDTDWKRDQLQLGNGARLFLDPQQGAGNRFAGASIRRKDTTHYGRYEVVMQPARGPGIITGFFTYTGRYYGTRHDEIDIEFLGKDTTKLHAAWFVDGKLNNRFIDLGFDAADRPRTYAFEWLPDRIRWFAEGHLIFEITDSETELPTVPGFLFANIWAADPSLDTWSGIPLPNASTEAFVKSVRFIPLHALPDHLS